MLCPLAKEERPSCLSAVHSSKVKLWWYEDILMHIAWVACTSVKAPLILDNVYRFQKCHSESLFQGKSHLNRYLIKDGVQMTSRHCILSLYTFYCHHFFICLLNYLSLSQFSLSSYICLTFSVSNNSGYEIASSCLKTYVRPWRGLQT